MRPALDLKLLQKVEAFTGKEARWRDWPIVFKAAAGAAVPGLGPLMQRVEFSRVPTPNMDLTDEEENVSAQLYFMLCTSHSIASRASARPPGIILGQNSKASARTRARCSRRSTRRGGFW